MTTIMKKISKGIVLTGESSDVSENLEGSLFHNSSTARIKSYIQGAVREVLTNSQSQVLTNKTIDVDFNTISNVELDNLKAGVLNTSSTLTLASDSQIPSALAVKTYTDNSSGAVQSNLGSHTSASTAVHGLAIGSSVVGTTDNQTLTTKTINADNNTISNLEVDNLKSGVLNTSITLDSASDTQIPSALAVKTYVDNNSGGGGTAGPTVLTFAQGEVLSVNNAVYISSSSTVSKANSSSSKKDFIGFVKTLNAEDVNFSEDFESGNFTSNSWIVVNGTQANKFQVGTATSYGGSYSAYISNDNGVSNAYNNGTSSKVWFYKDIPIPSGIQFLKFRYKVIGEFTGFPYDYGRIIIDPNLTTTPVAGTDITVAPSGGVNITLPSTANVWTERSINLSSYVGTTIRVIFGWINDTGLGTNPPIAIDSITVSKPGTCDVQVDGILSGFSGLTSGNLYYLSSTAGNIVAAPINTVKSYNIPVGIAISSTEIEINPVAFSGISEYTRPTTNNTNILFYQDFENTLITDFTQVGLSLDTVSNLHGTVSAKLIHQSGVSPTNDQYVKQIIVVEPKFRGKNHTIQLTAKSAASAGNVVLKITDETASTDLVVSEQLQLSNNAGGASSSVSFDIPETCLSLSYTITALPEAGSPVTIVDDIYCALTASNLFQSGVVQEEDSMIQLQGANGYGSTATKIRRFLNTQLNKGSDILYQDSSINGATFTVLTSGIYHISYLDQAVAGTSAFLGITKNASVADSITNISTLASNTGDTIVLAASRRYDAGGDVGFLSANCNWSGYLEAGDVIRAHTNGVANVDADITRFTISKQGSLKQVTINSNQKITIPTSELRFEGASSRGTGTETAIVEFTSLAKLRGDAFTIDNSNGTAITMTKAGKLNISCTSAAATVSTFQITKNQTIRTGLSTVPSEVLSAAVIGVANSAASCSAITDVNIGDIIRISSNAVPSGSPNISLNLSFQQQEVQVSVSNTLPQFSESDSCVQLTGTNGFGSTATTTRRFASVVQNIGTDIEYVNSSTLGGQFIAKSAGIYHVSYSEISTANSAYLANQLLVNGTGVAYDSERYNTANTSSKYVHISWAGYLNAGDVITGIVEASSATDSFSARFTISKVGRPNVTGVDVTPFVNVPQPESQSSSIIQSASFSGGATFTGALTSSISSGIYSYNSSTGIYTVLKKAQFDIAVSVRAAASASTICNIVKNGIIVAAGSTASIAGYHGSTSFNEIFVSGDTFYFSTGTNATDQQKISILATALSDQILTAPETFSTDTTSLQYVAGTTDVATTLANLATYPVGSYTTFTYAGGGNARSHTITRPTQTDADMNTNGIQIFTRVYASPSSASQPSVVAIQIGKGLKGISTELYKSATKSISGSLQLTNNSAFTNQTGSADGVLYDSNTGILIIDVGLNIASTVTSNSFRFNDLSAQTSGYLVINASKNPALTGFGLNRIAARASSTSGQAITTTNTIQSFTEEMFDTNGAWNGSTFTAPETGYYQVSANLITAAVLIAASGGVVLDLYKNGSVYSTTRCLGTGASNTHNVQTSDVVFLNKNDTVSAYARSTVATTQNTTAGFNFISISKVSI